MAVTAAPQRSASGRAFSRITQRMIALEPGQRYRVVQGDEAIAAERPRMGSRIRTATMQTGRKYRIFTERGALYVRCEAA